MSETYALVIEDLAKQYPSTTALAGVSLKIEQGKIYGLLGPNGAGKSTLIGAVCGLVRKTRGRISIFGVDVDAHPLQPRYDIGLVPQEVSFDPFFTSRETLELQLGYYGRPPDPKRVDEILEVMKLTDKADASARSLSGGMKRRLLIGKALVHRPKLLFLDEPTAGVDVELRDDLWRYVRQLRNEGTTIVLTTHYLEEAEQLADSVGIIDHGRLLFDEPTSQAIARLGERRLIIRLTSPMTSVPIPGLELRAHGSELVYRERAGQGATIAEMLAKVYAASLPVADVSVERPRLEDVVRGVLQGGRAQ